MRENQVIYLVCKARSHTTWPKQIFLFMGLQDRNVWIKQQPTASLGRRQESRSPQRRTQNVIKVHSRSCSEWTQKQTAFTSFLTGKKIQFKESTSAEINALSPLLAANARGSYFGVKI